MSWGIGDQIYCRADITGRYVSFEAEITGVGENYLRLQRENQTFACYPKDAILLRSADGSRVQLHLLKKQRGGARPGAGRRKGEVSQWIHTPTKSIRVPEAFADDLRAIAQQMDWGEWPGVAVANQNEQPDRAQLTQIKELLQRWNAEAVGKKPKFDRSWGKALNLLAELNQILNG